ncbi:MAG: isoprenyl transferase [Candidatus Brocadiia bacterium]
MAEVPEKRPQHVAIIMDGNGRWARQRDLPRTEGHSAGAETARSISKCCVKYGISYLTLYAFSTENWRRPDSEVRFLMKRLRDFLVERRDEMVEEGIALQAIGRTGELPRYVQRELARTLEATQGGENLVLNLAVNYGARSEIVDACRAIARDAAAGEIRPDEVDEELMAEHMYTAGQPDPDLLIRTGGEMRLSNFLLWQVCYAELYVTETLWPDFDEEQFVDALNDYAARERRFGGL